MNKRLLILSGLAILAVAMNHASHAGFVAMFWWTDRYLPVTVPNYDQMGSASYYGLIAAQKLALFSVPSFLFITGVFLAYTARGSQSRLSWGVVFHRVLNLLPPYLIWSVVFYVVEYLIGGRHSAIEYVLGFVSIDHSEFFYVPLIIVYYLLSPFLVPLAKNRPRLLVTISIVVLVAGIATGYLRQYYRFMGIENTIFSAPASYLLERPVFEFFFYYVVGLVVGFYQAPLKAFITRYRWVLLGLVFVAGALAIAEAEWIYQISDRMTDWRSRTLTLPTVLYALSFILTFMAFEQVTPPFSGLLYRLGVNTLGIYLMHKSVLLVAPKIIYHALPVILGMQFIYQPILVALAVGLPFLFMLAIQRLPVRKYHRILFG